ncbi:hypothetical protein [Photobacterium damselae]|uniref:hypothetical protein n=1 Tax=Photobacterium damselae TaxID=38293 RepID=UPI001F44C45F|nr:hypothetical protein [Photobacterium damselae]UKA12835.1 hypothetical protein IHC91_21315 [Photobacterium damselae subsp. damselae]
MKGNFFVMLTTQDGGYTPLMKRKDGDSDVEFAKFDTEEEARQSAESTTLGEMFGYEVFEIGCGC